MQRNEHLAIELPTETLSYIFSFLDYSDIRHVLLVSKLWNVTANLKEHNPDLFQAQRDVFRNYHFKISSFLDNKQYVLMRKHYMNTVMDFLFNHQKDWVASVNYLERRYQKVESTYRNAAALRKTLRKLQEVTLKAALKQHGMDALLTYFQEINANRPLVYGALGWTIMNTMFQSDNLDDSIYAAKYLVLEYENTTLTPISFSEQERILKTLEKDLLAKRKPGSTSRVDNLLTRVRARYHELKQEEELRYAVMIANSATGFVQ